MDAKRIVKRIRRADHKRCVTIYQRNDGNYSFVEDADGDAYTYDTWPSLATGTIYETADIAEREARAQAPWMEQTDCQEDHG
jgi:hypothetical protein